MFTALETRVLTALVQKFPAPKQLLGLSMMPRVATSKFPGTTAEWDVQRASRSLGELNVPGAKAKLANLMQEDHITSRCLYKRDRKALSAATLYHVRRAGDQYDVLAGEAKVKAEAQDLDQRFDRTAEWAIWQMLATGELAAEDLGVNFTIDYGMDPTHLPTVTTDWDDYTDSDPVADLTAWQDLIRNEGGEEPTDCFMTPATMAYLINNATVRELLRNQYGKQMLENGYIEKLLGMNLYKYGAGYIPEGGVFTPFIPDNTVVLIAKGNTDRIDMGGKIENTLADVLEGSSLEVSAEGKPGKFAKSYESEDPSGIQLIEDWYFLPALFKAECVVSATVIQ